MGKKSSALAVAAMVLLVLWMMISPIEGCPYDGSKCRECIVKQMKCGCPPCVPKLRCMARCLWGGTSKFNCINRCDCGGGPKLSDCKKCMSKCKCSCMIA